MAFSGFSCHTRKRPFPQVVGWDHGSESESPFHQKHYKTSSRVISRRLGLEDLPNDIIFNILLILPVKSLLQCRCVCKTWRSIIDSPRYLNLTSPLAAFPVKPRLMLLEMDNCKTMRLSLVKDDDNTNTLRRSQFPFPRIANAENYCVDLLGFGFFCIKDKCYGRQIFLFNPLRGEFVMLPPVIGPSHNQKTAEFYGLGYDSTKEEYKLVRVFNRSPGYIFDKLSLGTEVYTLGTRSWRAISAVPPLPLSYSGSVSAYGDVHWKVVSRLPSRRVESMIVTFDIRKEKFKCTPQPDFPSKHYVYFQLLDWKGSLAMVDFSSTKHIDIWLLKDYCKKKWAREYRISCEMWLTEHLKFGWRYWGPDRVNVVGVWEDGLIFIFMLEYMFYYNTKTDSLTLMKPPCIEGRYLSYTGSLVSLKNYGNLITREVGHGNVFDLSTASILSTLNSMKI